MLRIIGIDLAVSASHKAIILDPASNKFIGKQITFRPRPVELDRLLAKSKAGAAEPVELVAVMEATGMAWYPVGVYLHQRGLMVAKPKTCDRCIGNTQAVIGLIAGSWLICIKSPRID